MIETWALPTWAFFHTLAEKISKKFLEDKTSEILQMIKLICANLPCPVCREHAITFMNTVSPNSIKTKKNLRNMFFYFHNNVNARLGKRLYKGEKMKKYKYGRFDIIYSNFVSNYTRNYNTRLLAGKFSTNYKRKQIGKQLNVWFKKNWNNFN